MVGPWSVLRALATTVAILGTSALAGPASNATPAEAAEQDPLAITIDTLAPSVVPRRGPLTITGAVTNTSDQEWRAINVYALTGTVPITTAEELEEAAQTDPGVQVGTRITDVGIRIDVLAPGQSVPYSLRVPRREILIGTEPGVYWLGVQALGETDEGRDLPADGRARTFWPLLPTEREPIDVALVLSMRRAVLYDPDGRVSDPEAWGEDLKPSGRLSQLANVAQAAGDRRLTWAIDPALGAAAAQIAAGNPPRSLDPTIDPGGEPSSSPSETSDGAAGEAADETLQPEARTLSRSGNAWLNRTRRALAGDQILLLAYGDLDVAAAADLDPERYAAARGRTGGKLPELGLSGSPAVLPPSGYLDPAALSMLPEKTTVLVENSMVPTAGNAPVTSIGELRVAVARKQALAGGPGPGPRRRPVDLRQRLLSEAALAQLAGDASMIASFPMKWTPGMSPATATQFFAGLDVDGVRLRSLRHVLRGPEVTPVAVDDLVYPDRQARRELDASNFVSARALTDAGRLLDGLLPLNDQIGRVVAGESFASTSYPVRDLPSTARLHADQARVWITRRLGAVTIDPPPSVTLSGTSGPFSVTVTNDLDQPVRVRVAAQTDSGLEIADSEPLELSPQERGTATMEASSTDPNAVGVHAITLTVVDESGRPLGGAASFPLRVARVSDVIWVVIGVGVALLFMAIVVRLFRRIRGWLAARGRAA